MLFHITYEFSPQERDGAQKRFKETGAPPPNGVTMQGSRWRGKFFSLAKNRMDR
jgi:hypothetical protein